MIPPVRSLMQTQEETTDKDYYINLGIGVGTFLAAILALSILSCLYGNWKDRRLEDQKRKYADWTEEDGIFPEFYCSSVKPSRKNPLNLAIEMKNLPLVKKLVENRIQSCNALDGLGHYALYYAAGTGSKEIVSYIADHTPDDFRPEGRSPLHVAAANADFPILDFLVNKFPELQSNIDLSGKTYLKELCVNWIGVNYRQPCPEAGRNFSEFIYAHHHEIPKELLEELLFPFRDLSQEQVSIQIEPLDEEDPELLEV